MSQISLWVWIKGRAWRQLHVDRRTKSLVAGNVLLWLMLACTQITAAVVLARQKA
jgi:hypothetical protein